MNRKDLLTRLAILAIVAACLVYVLANMETEDQAAARLQAGTEKVLAENDQLERRLREADVDLRDNGTQRNGGGGQ